MVNKFWYRRAGLERVMFDEIAWLEEAGHQVAHFSLTHPENDPSPWSYSFAPYLEIGPQSELTRRQQVVATGRMFWNQAAARRFSRLLRDFRPDVVHVQGIHRQVSPSILAVARSHGVPVVQGVHDHHPICASSDLLRGGTSICDPPRCGRFNVLPCLSSRCVQSSTARSGLAALELLSRRSLIERWDLIDAMICPSRYLADRLSQGGLDPSKLQVVPNAVPFREDEPPGGRDPAEPANAEPFFLYAGRLSREKGLRTLLRAVKMAGVRLVVAGDGPQMAELRELAPPTTAFLGRISGERVDALLKNCRAAVLPSECPEIAPMAVLEAMAWGRPAIASRVGGVPEQLRDGVEGILTPPGDAQALAVALSVLAEDADLADRFGVLGRKRVAQHFSPEAHLNGILRVYDKVLAESPARSSSAARPTRPLRVAAVGSRGMPGVHGGIERHVEELYPRLAGLGVDVTVYARKQYVEKDCSYEGVRVISLPSLGGRSTEAISHTVVAILHARSEGCDVLHVHAIGPALALPLARLLGFRHTVLTVHARDYERAKWGRVAARILRFSERVGMATATQVIAVSEYGAEDLHRRYGRAVHAIPNGPGALVRRPPGELLRGMGLRGGDYVLFVGRLIPEKCPDDLVEAAASAGLHVVFAGDSSYTDQYVRALRDIAGDRAHFPGYMYGEDLEELYSSALAFVLPSEVEGLSISLLEAMAYGLPCIVSDIPGNVEALGEPPCGIIYPLRSCAALSNALVRVAQDCDLRRQLGEAAQARVMTVYDWDRIAEQTLAVYEQAVGRDPLRAAAEAAPESTCV